MTERCVRAAIGALALVGMGIAGYLTYVRYTDGSLYCVAGSGGCQRVEDSEYAKLASIPVSVLGIVMYAVLLVTALVPGFTSAAAGAGVAIAGTAFAGWLLYAQLVLVDAVCHWCLANDLVISLIAVAAVLRLRKST